ncbi:dethiobiotin synthase [Ectothiorhodospiraceae bacterium BW-2]|nr:dethiobiotin synthase [Ectothiorhodospiraceae bacterium BW-2]
MSRALFITGTDTDVGKTWVSCGVMVAARASFKSIAAMKPIASGCQRSESGLQNRDAQQLQRLTTPPLRYEQINPYAFEPAIAPHIAAAAAGVEIDLTLLQRHYQQRLQSHQLTIIEGAGGWLVPLNRHHTVADMAQQWQLPVILVVGLRLGCLNHALLTATAISASGCPFLGWIGNPIEPNMAAMAANIETLMQWLPSPCLGITPHLNRFDPEQIAAAIDWPEIEKRLQQTHPHSQ